MALETTYLEGQGLELELSRFQIWKPKGCDPAVGHGVRLYRGGYWYAFTPPLPPLRTPSTF